MQRTGSGVDRQLRDWDRGPKPWVHKASSETGHINRSKSRDRIVSLPRKPLFFPEEMSTIDIMSAQAI